MNDGQGSNDDGTKEDYVSLNTLTAEELISIINITIIVTTSLRRRTRAENVVLVMGATPSTALATSVTMKPGEVPPTAILRACTNPQGRGCLLNPHGRGNGKPVMVQ